MSTSLTTMIRLRAIQNKIRQLFDDMDDATYRNQFHEDLSPLGWHLGHCMFIENYWLHEVVRNTNKFTKKLDKLYIPENCPKPLRGKKLPKLNKLLKDIQQQQDDNAIGLLEMIPPVSEHKLFKDEYLQNFLIQHYAQHYETMQMILNQIAINNDEGNFQPSQILTSSGVRTQHTRINADQFDIGGESAMSYDNELPRHSVDLDAFNIANHPISNAEYLAFMEDAGYETRSYWSEAGWQWRNDKQIRHPEHWKQNDKGEWYGIRHDGPFELENNSPLYGISYYEARAFASWAHARLPHEHQWEAAVNTGQLSNTGQVWEWCENRFYPYDGFTAFPYDGYSIPWFDDKHYVLRGASKYTRPEIRRATFRNFFNPDKRHIFAGFRLVFD